MKPKSFDYHAPVSLEEALVMLRRYGGDARLLAGGQSLVPMMNFRLVAPAAIVDLNRIPGLATIEAEGAVVRMGAMTRQRTIEFSPIVAEKLPLLREAIKLVGHLPTRSRGTIGGSIAHADPAAELPMVLQALAGHVVVRAPHGERRIAAADLFCDALTTSLEPDEILVEVVLPAMPAGARYAVEEFARRHGDFAIAAIAVVLVRDGERCMTARMATAGISSHSVRLHAAEQILEAEGLSEIAIAHAADKAAELVEPVADQNASAEFRRHLTRVLTRRALIRAVGCAK
jgi:aerobic carbon-monoxide dehydrogenase medium subunit